jgi:hypothetical protein
MYLERRDTMDRKRMLELAQQLAVAKSRQDVPAALKVLHRQMLLEAPAFGTSARGLAENERTLTRFFKTFPDYDVVLEGHAATDDTLVCWGRVRMTMTGDRFGVVPNWPARRAAGVHPVRLQARSHHARALRLRSR